MSRQPDPAGLTDGSYTGGVYRLLDAPEDVARKLADAGWLVGVAGEAARTRDFYRQVATAMGFGDYFGANLDALWDSLTDIPVPTVLVLSGWTTFARARPERWQRIFGVLQERAATDPPFAVVLGTRPGVPTRDPGP